jgi:hypothetical protein
MIITDDDANNLKQAWSNLQTAFESEVKNRNARDVEIQEYIETLQAKQEQLEYLVRYIIEFIESKLGPLGGRFPLITEDGYYLVTENSDYLVVA